MRALQWNQIGLRLAIVAFAALLSTSSQPSSVRAADEPKSSKSKKTDEEKAAEEAKRAADKKAADDARKAADDAKKAADQKKLEDQRAAEAKARAERQALMDAETKARAERQAALEAEMKAKAAAKAEKDRLDAIAAAEKAALKVITDRADGILKRKLSRTADEAYRAVTLMNTGTDKTLPEDERYVLYVQAGEWEKLRDLIAPYPSDYPQRMYSKVLNDFTQYGNRPVLLPTDVLRLGDAAPAELDDKQTIHLGRMLAFAVAKTDSRAELMKLLEKGTKHLGGTDPARRRAAARVLAAAEFWAEAKEFGLAESEVATLTSDAKVISEMKPDAPAKLADTVWEDILAVVRDKNRPAAERDDALTRLHVALVQSTPQVVQTRLGSLVGQAADDELAWEIVALLGRKTAVGLNDFDFDARRINLELQHATLRLLPSSRTLKSPPGATFANLYARNWQTEALNTWNQYPLWRKTTVEGREKYKHVPLESMLETAPSGDWLAALDPQSAGALKLMIARLILLSDNTDRLLPMLPDFVARDRMTAADLANVYLSVWAMKHDPNFTPEAMKQYKLDGNVIALTRAEQEVSLGQLGTLLSKLDAESRKLLNEAEVVRAFDLCHSRAEVYTYDHIERVFGKLEAMQPSLLLSLVERMRTKLSLNWRQLSVQRDAATRRSAEDVFQLVNDGYEQGDRVTAAWLKAHPNDWRMACVAGSLLADWAEFSYFQAVVAENDQNRFATYLKRSAESLERFRSSAKAYAAVVPKMKRTEFELLPYRAWFYGLLGIATDTDVNLRKGVTKEGLEEIRRAMTSLPNGAGPVHLGLFSAMVADNVKQNRIAPEMKYRYLSSAVAITGRQATTYPAEEKVQYYDSLLSEIRLRTRLDGSDKIHARGPFGIFVTLVHTADLARESGGFGKYLQNEIKKTINGKAVTEQPFYRDKFEESLRLSLGDFFEVKAIVFADPAAGARDLPADDAAALNNASPGATSKPRVWQETPLAYVYLVAKDPTVDRVPPLEIELDFFDRDGKVVVPVPANPVLVEVSDQAAKKRQIANVEVTEIVDGRELTPENEVKHLKIDVVATAAGLVPDLEELIDLKSYSLPVTAVDEREGLLVREFQADDEGLRAKSERSWTVHLDPTPLLTGAGGRIEFDFPKPKSSETKIAYKRYEDLDPVEAAAKLTLVEGEAATQIARPNYTAWGLGALAGLIAVGGIIAVAVRRKPVVDDKPVLFEMPKTVTPFSTVNLLTRIQTSPHVTLSDEQRSQLSREIAGVERAAFAAETDNQNPRELETLASRWLNVATTNGSSH